MFYNILLLVLFMNSIQNLDSPRFFGIDNSHQAQGLYFKAPFTASIQEPLALNATTPGLWNKGKEKREVFRPNPTIFMVSGAGVLAGCVLDALVMPARDEWANDQFLQTTSKSISNVGNGTVLGGAALAITLTGMISHHEALRQTGSDLVKGTVMTAVLVTGMKWLTGRLRPFRLQESDSPFRFDPLSQGGWSSSLPSGHAAMSWMFATVVDRHTGGKTWIRGIAYGLATLISLSRITGNRHHPSDIILGASIGYLVGRFITR